VASSTWRTQDAALRAITEREFLRHDAQSVTNGGGFVVGGEFWLSPLRWMVSASIRFFSFGELCHDDSGGT
jgi:hypothetical protein